MAAVDDRGRRTAPTRRQQRGPRRQQGNDALTGAIVRAGQAAVKAAHSERNVTRPRVVPSQVRDDKSDRDRARGRRESERAIQGAQNRQVARALETVANAVPSRYVKPKRGGSLFMPAVIDSLKGTGALQDATHAVSGAFDKYGRVPLAIGTVGFSEIPLRPIQAARDFGLNAVKDAINLPAEAVPSLYHLGEQAVHGDVKGALRDLAQPYIDTAKDPLGSFHEHPLNTYLLGAGVKGAAGRGTGRAMRAVPGPTRRMASTARAPLVDEATGMVVDRAYSPDVISKATQVAVERARGAQARRLEAKAARVGGDRAVAVREKAAQRRGTLVPDHEFQRRVDERVDTNEQVRRDDMSATKHAARVAVRQVHPKERPLVALVARAAVPATRDGVTAYLRQIEAAGAKLTGAKRAANRETIKHLEGALARDVDWAKVREASKAYAAVRAPLEKGLGDAEIVNPAQAERRRLLPFVVQQLGGKLKTADELDGAVKDARQRLHEARQELAAHERTHADAVAGFGVARGRAQVLSRQVGGTAAERRAAAATVPAGETQFAGGGHGVRQAATALRSSTENVRQARLLERAAFHDLRVAVHQRRQGSGFLVEKTIPATSRLEKTGETVARGRTEQPLDLATRKAIARRARRNGGGSPVRRNVASQQMVWGTNKNLPVERTSGTPEVAADKAEWFHGTPHKFEGVPSAKGQWSDLGVYLTSDPMYARGYSKAHPDDAAGHVVPLRVSPRNVLDMRGGRANPAELARVVEVMRALGEKSREGTRKGTSVVEREMERWGSYLSSGEKLDRESMYNLQSSLLEASEYLGEHEGLRGTGNRHQVLSRVLRALGYDAVRKVDQHADALVVLDERIMRRHTGTEGAPKKRAAEAAIPVRHYATKRTPERRVEERLTNEEIRAEMRRRGVDEPAFLTDAPNRRGARNFFRNQMEPANAGSGTFTGEALRQGTIDLHPETLIEGAANAQSLVSQQHGFGRMLHEFGVRGADGEVAPFASFKAAEKAARDAATHRDGTPRPGAVKLKPVRINPFGGTNAQLEKLLEQADLDPMARRSIHEALDSALSGSDGPGPWALVPEVVAKRMQDHLRVLGAGGPGKVANVVNQAFRRTVLATSIPWLTGNVLEGAGRALIAHAGPMSWVTGGRLLKALDVMDPLAAQELRSRALNGAHISMAERQKIRRAAEDFDGRFTRPMARALGAFWRTPGPKQVAGLWGIWTDIAFNQTNGRFERNVQRAMLGRAVRRSPLMEGHVNKLGQRAIMEAARGLTNTSTQVAFARSVDRMYGRYSKFSPTARKYIANYTPFLAWSLAATNFIYRVLPRDHPVLTSMIVAANEATQDWRREHGLDMFFADGRLPGWLQGSIPTPGGGHVRVSRYTPFGAFGASSETVEALVLPQTQGVLAALRGEDWKGKELRDDKGQPVDEIGRWTAAAGSFLESVTPALSQTKRVLGEDSVGAGLKKIANPVPVIAPSEDEAVAPSGPMDPKMSRAFRRAQTSAARRGGQSKQLERAFRRAQRLAAQQP